MASRLALSLLFISAVAVGHPFTRDSPEVQIIRNLITDANNYLEDHSMTEIHLLNIGGYLPTDIVELTNGRLGRFNTIRLQGTPTIDEVAEGDGWTQYNYDVSFGLSEIYMNYTFEVNMGLFKRVGPVRLFPTNNTFSCQGVVTVRTDGGTCVASMSSLSIEKFGKLILTISPDDIPGLSTITQAILNLASSSLVPSINLAVGGLINSSVFQQRFSDFVCQRISNPSDQ